MLVEDTMQLNVEDTQANESHVSHYRFTNLHVHCVLDKLRPRTWPTKQLARGIRFWLDSLLS